MRSYSALWVTKMTMMTMMTTMMTMTMTMTMMSVLFLHHAAATYNHTCLPRDFLNAQGICGPRLSRTLYALCRYYGKRSTPSLPAGQFAITTYGGVELTPVAILL